MNRRLPCKSLKEGMEANNAGSQPNNRNTFILSTHLTEEPTFAPFLSFIKEIMAKNKTWDKLNLSRPSVPDDIIRYISDYYIPWDKLLGQIQFVPCIFLSRNFPHVGILSYRSSMSSNL